MGLRSQKHKRVHVKKALTVRYESKIITKRMNGQSYTECMLAYPLKKKIVTVRCERNTNNKYELENIHIVFFKISEKKKTGQQRLKCCQLLSIKHYTKGIELKRVHETTQYITMPRQCCRICAYL